MSLSSSFGAVGSSDHLLVTGGPKRIVGTLSGTYVATVQLERAVASAGHAWEKVAGPWSTDNATVEITYTTKQANERLRLRATSYTSGSVVYTLKVDPVVTPDIKVTDDPYNADPLGVEDSSEAFERAMVAAEGNPLIIPAGTYSLKDCKIPEEWGCHLVPDGNVTFTFDGGGSWGCMYMQGENNWSDEIDITAVADITTYPASGDQVVTRLTCDASSFSPGDIVFIYTNEQDGDGADMAEMSEILEVDASDTYVLCNKKLYNTFDTASYSPKIRRCEKIVPFIIKKGITFTADGDPSAVATSRRSMMHIRMPIRPEVEVHLNNTWSTGINPISSFLGSFKVTYQDIWVDYSASPQQLGYVVSRSGACFGTRFSVSGNKSGALCDNAITTGATQSWFKRGSTLDNIIHDSYAHNCRRSAFRTHGTHRELYLNCVAMNSAMDDEENNNFWNAFAMKGRDITLMNCYAQGTLNFLAPTGDYGSSVTDEWNVINCGWLNDRDAGVGGSFVQHSLLDTPNKSINIVGGFAKTNGNLFTIFNELGHLRIAGGFVGRSTGRLLRTQDDVTVYLDDLTFIGETGASTAVCNPSSSGTLTLHVGNLRVIQDGSNNPVALVNTTSPATANIYADRDKIVVPTGSAFDFVHTSSTGTSNRNMPESPIRMSAAPVDTVTTYAVGDIVYDDTPSASGTIGWVCVTAGAPGTWKAFGTIAA